MDRVFVSRERLYAQQSTDDIKSKKKRSEYLFSRLVSLLSLVLHWAHKLSGSLLGTALYCACSPLIHIQTNCSSKFVILYQFDRSTAVSYALKVWQYHHTLYSRRACRVSFSIESRELSSAQRLSCWHSRTGTYTQLATNHNSQLPNSTTTRFTVCCVVPRMTAFKYTSAYPP